MEVERSGLPTLEWGLEKLEIEESRLDRRLYHGRLDVPDLNMGFIEKNYLKIRLLHVRRLLSHPKIQEEIKQRDILSAAAFEKSKKDIEIREKSTLENRKFDIFDRYSWRGHEGAETIRREMEKERKYNSINSVRSIPVIVDVKADSGDIVEAYPVILIGLEGVVTSLKTRMFHRTFDPDAISLIARLARKIDAKLILMSPLAQKWPTGAEALQQKIIAGGWSTELWHREWMLPVNDANIWQELDTWLARRNCDELSALIIQPDGIQYPGELPGDVGDFYTFAPNGFTQWDYFKILSVLGLSDDDVSLPPNQAESGFRATPGKWRGKKIKQASLGVAHASSSFPRPS